MSSANIEACYLLLYSIKANLYIYICIIINYIYTYIYIYIYICNYIYIYMYMYMYKLNLEGIQYDIIDTSSFMLHAIFSQYFYL